MAKAYYSTIFDQSADAVWSVLRDFNAYRVFLDNTESHIEDGKTGETVGAVRNVTVGERNVRQQLMAHSDIERTYSYRFCPPSPLPVSDFLAQIKVTPVVDGNRAFIEWSATFDCIPEEAERWRTHYAQAFAGWLASLRRNVEGPIAVAA
ncbi:MAG TPA: SRPBCC family protein [Pseudolabrys sp.]|nr:SRPBCC family protein [Pseudolabrys sp.]